MTGRRAAGTNPRAAGTNPRAIARVERAARSASIAAAIAKRPSHIPSPICGLVERALVDDKFHEVTHADPVILARFVDYVFTCCKAEGLLCNVRYSGTDRVAFAVGLTEETTQ